MAYDNTHLVKLAALKALAEKVKSDYALKADLTALSGRVDNLVAAGGEPNVLTGIKVNGTLLDLTEKIADILIAEGKTNGTIAANGVDVPVHGLAALAYKSEVSETELAKALKDAIDAKAKQADLDTLTGEGEGSIKKMIDDAFNDFSTKVSDDGVVNSYKELIDWAATHGSEATKMAKGISENKTAIANLKKYVGTLPEGATATDVVGYIAEAIAALSIGDYAKTTEVTAAINTALADYAKTSDVNTGLGKKADKVAKATNGNFAALDADGNLPGWFALELMAQTVGVWSEWHRMQKGLPHCALGMVLGARELVCDAGHFAAGSTLTITIERLMQDERFGSFECTIHADNISLATGRVNTFQPSEEELTSLFNQGTPS